MYFCQTIAEGRQSYVTLATNDEYAIGALVLGYSLRLSKTNKELTILITEGVPHNFRELLKAVYDNLVVVKPQHSREDAHLYSLRRPDLGITYTKLYCWKLIEFTKCVFLDADTIVLQNIDELFQRKELSAAPDTSWPDIFNSGVFVYRPCLETFYELSLLAKTKGSFDGGDQGLLNEYFSNWSTETLDKHLPFSYNCSCWVLPNDNLMFYTRPAAWKKFGSQVKVAHFAGYEKPWKHRVAANDEAIWKAIERLECSDTAYTTAEQTGVLALWWAIFFKRVKHQLSHGMFLSTVFEPVPPPPPPSPQDDFVNNRQEHNEFWAENQNYHPEFSDTTFDFLHSGQRVDESNRFKEYHEYFEPPKPPPAPEHHKYYETRKTEFAQHEFHHHQPVYYEDRHQHELPPPPPPPQPQQKQYHHRDDKPHYEDIVFHPYVPEHRYEPPPQSSLPPPSPQEHHQHQEYHQEQSDHQWHQEQSQQQWQEHPHHDHSPHHESAPLPQPQAEPVNDQRHPPPSQPPQLPREPSPPPPVPPPASPPPPIPQPPPPPEPRNDKDPLFFVPKPLCRECLRELQWSRQFVDPFHRDIISPLSPQSRNGSQVRRRSQPPWSPETQLIREMPKSPAPPVIPDKDSLKLNDKEPRKKEKMKEKSLHQVQKGKSVPKKRLKKPIDRSKLVDAAKRRMQAKRGSTSSPEVTSPAEDMDQRLTEPTDLKTTSPEPDLTSTISSLAGKESKPQSAELKPTLVRGTAPTEKKAEDTNEDDLVELQQKLKSVTPPATATRAKRQRKDGESSEKLVNRSKAAGVEATPAKRPMKLAEVEEKIKPKTFLKLESEPTPIKAVTSKRSHLTKPAERVVSKEAKAVHASAERREKQQPPPQKLEARETMKEVTRSAKPKSKEPEKVAEPTTEEPVVESAPWIPRAKEIRNQPQKESPEEEYFCDRHRPYPPPPEWRMSAWERGEIDYMGNDRFCNILARIRSTIQQSEDEALPIGIWL
ncbi:hypothetical protein Aperf_G00000024046 [Anoplocephala perfoliata]